MGLLWGWVVGLDWVVSRWPRFWVPRWIQGLCPIWGLGLQVGWRGVEQSGRGVVCWVGGGDLSLGD